MDCKICIDGKKLAVGFGKKLGDEDLAGHEERPTLMERQVLHNSELDILQHATDMLTEQEFEKTLMELGHDQKTDLKCTFLEIIKVITDRTKGIRETAVKTSNALVSILKKVQGNWMTSEFKGAISFLNTKLIKADSCTTRTPIYHCSDMCHTIYNLQCIGSYAHPTVRYAHPSRTLRTSSRILNRSYLHLLASLSMQIKGFIHAGKHYKQCPCGTQYPFNI